MTRFQPSMYSYTSDWGAAEAALVEQAPSPVEVSAAQVEVVKEQAKSQGFLAAQIGKLKDEMVDELHFRKLLVTMVGSAVVMVGTGLVAAWLRQKLKDQADEEVAAQPGALPAGVALDLACTARPAQSAGLS